MPRNVSINQFRYLQTIVEVLDEFYKKDRELLMSNRRTHEQTVSFRLGTYLAQRLESENDNMYVDCEYHGDINNDSFRKEINGKRVRPDIIFHDRNRRNEFCIEVKLQSMGRDYEKINGYIAGYGYREGYCIYNIGKNFITLSAFSANTHYKGIKFRYHFNPDRQVLEQNLP